MTKLTSIELHHVNGYWYIITHWDDGHSARALTDGPSHPFRTRRDARNCARRTYWRDVPVIITGAPIRA